MSNAALYFSPEAIEEAKQMSWRMGVLNYRRRNTQKYLKLKTEEAKRKSRKVYWETTRRLGKSTEILQSQSESCIQKPEWTAGFFAPVKEGLLDYIDPIISDVFDDCPASQRPYFDRQRFMLRFPNRSTVKFRGSNNRQHRVRRGNDFCEAAVDECRDVDRLDELVDSVIFPSLFNNEGYVTLASTPADSRSHPLFRYRQQAETGGWLIRLSIWDANRMDPLVYPIHRILEWQRETMQGVDGEAKWKREYECEWVINATRAAVPEWNNGFVRKIPHDPYYSFYQHYISIDWGYKDFTAINFGTHMFRQALLQIEGELAFSGKDVRSDLISEAISNHAEKLWGPDWTARQVADCADPIATNEINKYPGMSFSPVEKSHTLDAMLQEFRVLANVGKILVAPECPLTQHCLANAIWTEKRDKLDQDVFARHFDHLMSTVYMTRILDWNANPIPADFMLDGHRIIDLNFDKKSNMTQAGGALSDAFRMSQRRW